MIYPVDSAIQLLNNGPWLVGAKVGETTVGGGWGGCGCYKNEIQKASIPRFAVVPED